MSNISKRVVEGSLISLLTLFWLFGKRRYILTIEVYAFE